MADLIILQEIEKVRQKNRDAQSQLRPLPRGLYRDVVLLRCESLIWELESLESKLKGLMVYPVVREVLRNNSLTEDEVFNQIYNPTDVIEVPLSATDEVVNSLLEITVGQEHIDVTQECSICLVELTLNEIIYSLPRCSHMFHNECIKEWMKSHTTCPVCRASQGLSSIHDSGVPFPHPASFTSEMAYVTNAMSSLISGLLSQLGKLNKCQDSFNVTILRLAENCSIDTSEESDSISTATASEEQNISTATASEEQNNISTATASEGPDHITTATASEEPDNITTVTATTSEEPDNISTTTASEEQNNISTATEQ